MARQIALGQNSKIYKVYVYKTSYFKPSQLIQMFGPYESIGKAKELGTKEVNHFNKWYSGIEGVRYVYEIIEGRTAWFEGN